ncbi:MAG: NADH-quinone oxidoreductase subunit G, partial [Planctomycetota bacterium]
RELEFEQGQTILQVALENEIEIPHYCYHDGLSIVANCRICLAEVWAPNPRNDNKLEAIPKLLPTCQTPAGVDQVVHTHSPKSIANQKAVMEYLLINHPVDCAVCDQAGECHLQDYSYQYGRSQARFQEQKIKQPKKDIGPNVLLYSDRCIMCTRCVRFTREVTGTSELIVEGRGSTEQIDIFPGRALDNELSGNVVDLCPVGALLDKDFLFQQRVWFLSKAPSIDGLTCSGDNISIEYNEDTVFRVKPRTNLDVNRWWITDEVRYGWKFVHADERLRLPHRRGTDRFEMPEAAEAWRTAYDDITARLKGADEGSVAIMISPMLSCEDAFHLGSFVLERDPKATFAVGPVPTRGEDKTFTDGFTMYAEKAPNARGVERVLSKLASGTVLDAAGFEKALSKKGGPTTVIVTGNYPSEWVTESMMKAIDSVAGRYVVLIDTLPNRLVDRADVLLPGATWMEKSGSFENVNGRLQAFNRAIDPIDYCKSEAQIALDLLAHPTGEAPEQYDAAATRATMAESHGMPEFAKDIDVPEERQPVESDMQVVQL